MSKRICILGMAVFLLVGCSALDVVIRRIQPSPEQAHLVGDPVRGEKLFRVGVDDAPPCSTCHQVGESTMGMSLAPNLAGIATRAHKRDATLTPEEYITQSILDPEKYKVSGFRVSMYTEYAGHLSQQDIADIVAFLMSA